MPWYAARFKRLELEQVGAIYLQLQVKLIGK